MESQDIINQIHDAFGNADNTIIHEEFQQELLEAKYIPRDMVESYLEKDVNGGQAKLKALTKKQKAACAAYLMYTAEKFENVYQQQLKAEQIYDEVESECRRIKVICDRFQALIN